MPNIIRDRNAVHGAPMEDLNYTYRALKDDPGFKGFTTRGAAEVQVQMAIMAAEDAVGHAGVPKGVKPSALTPAELAESNPYAPGTMSHKLHEEISAQQPIAARVRKAPITPGGQRFVIRKVRATMAGTTKPQASSVRNQVLMFIQNLPDQTATIQALEEHFQQPVRGHLQKLIEKNHLVVVQEDQ